MHERVPPHLGWRLTRGSRSPAVMGGGRPDHAYLVGTQSRFRTPLPSALSPFSLPASLHPAQRARSAAAMLSPLCLCSSLRVSVFTRIRRQPHPELRLRFAEPLRMLTALVTSEVAAAHGRSLARAPAKLMKKFTSPLNYRVVPTLPLNYETV